ncbi:hypothetical protein K474DRAFT_1336099 [Panus rudis PR-1116 ss-1]|nr:hypothetical protein K474DRAFT_1336099 [Panus rudis PR-1116 ss-1]
MTGLFEFPMIDVENFARQFITTCPTIRDIFVTWQSSERIGSDSLVFLQITDNPDGQVVRRLDWHAYDKFDVFNEDKLDV